MVRQTKAQLQEELEQTQAELQTAREALARSEALAASLDKDLKQEQGRPREPRYPYTENERLMIGPRCWVSEDRSMVVWQGLHFHREESKQSAWSLFLRRMHL